MAPTTRRARLASHGGRSWAATVARLVLLAVALSCRPAKAQELTGPVLRTVTSNGESHELPLLAAETRVTIDRGHADTIFGQTFQNETTEALEGRFEMALGGLGTATGFSYWNGAERIKGEIFEREAAADIYEEVSGTGKDPGLLEQSGEGVFAFRVAPIAPGEKKRVELGVAHFLRRNGQEYELRLPGARTDQRFEVTVRDVVPLRNFTSPNHDLKITEQKDLWSVSATPKPGKNGDFILRYTVDEADFTPTAAYHRDADVPGGYVLVRLPAPRTAAALTESRDVTLVLDHSGSMSGAPLAAARRAAVAVLSKLPPSDRVNVIAFDDDVASLRAEPQAVDALRQDAVHFVEAIQDGGGTDIARALQAALASGASSSRPRVILFLTDGQSDANAALTAARAAPENTRLYTVGIGAGVDRPLLSQLAQGHHGRFTYIADERNLERDVQALYESISAPLLTDLRVQIDGGRLEGMYPRSLPDLFRGDEICFAARLVPNPGSSHAKLSIAARQGKLARQFEAAITLGETRAPWVGRAWAEKRVDDLLEHIALDGETTELRNETIELALAYNLVTRYTSFLAIPESEVTDGVRGSLESERERRKQILARHADAAALSRSLMPPGDPLLSVLAPRSALGVTAVFPFGLSLELAYDETTERWSGRFLVPRDVADGTYFIDIHIIERDGTVRILHEPYTIDSRAPELVTTVNALSAGGSRLSVWADEALREVRVEALDQNGRALALCGAAGCRLERQGDHWAAELPEDRRTVGLRVVASDLAQNESESWIRAEPRP